MEKKNILLLRILFFQLVLTLGYASETSEVVIPLQDSTFDSFIEEHEFVLAEFYAPWCGHCKNLAPEFEKAAKVLKEHTPPVMLVKVDATEEQKLASRFNVQGYPTLKLFRKGQAEDFEGPRDSEGIVAEVLKKVDPNYKPPPEEVVSLGSAQELDEFVKSGELTLVEFYAPWCGHCKRLAPEFEAAAKVLNKHDPPIKLAKMDATEHKEVAEKYGVSGFPTMFLFRAKPGADGEMVANHSPYDGPREADGIIDYMIGQSGNAAKIIHNMNELKNKFLVDDIIVVGMFSSEDSEAYTFFQDSINNLRDKYKFYYTTDKDIRKRYKVEDKEAVVVILPELMVTKYDKPYHVWEYNKDDHQVSGILGFISSHETPLIGTRTAENKARYDRRPLCVLFVPVDWSHQYRDMTATWRNKLLPIANKFSKYLHFAMSDDEKMIADMKSFGFEESGSDFSIGCFGPSNEKLPMPELDEWDSEEIEEFLQKVKDGKAKPYLRSQIPPKKQTSPVVTVVGKTFKDIVFDETKDVLIEMYAPWCGHCKQFEPEYKKLAKELKSENNLVISKMNAEANDGPDGYAVQGYPTIYFAPSNNKQTPLKYEGNRDLDDIKSFIKGHATVSFKSEKDEL